MGTPKLEAVITGLFVGKAKQRWKGKPPSAIGKRAVPGPLRLTTTGFAEDEQADRSAHGGPDKAVHHYASDHLDHWRRAFPDKADRFIPGCFGENIATLGLTEGNLCLGDVLQIGSATVQICQGRQPCWKLNMHIGIEAMAAAFQKSARTGWYYRVVETGAVKLGDTIALVDRRHDDWTLDRLVRCRFDPQLDARVAAELSGMEALSESWRTAFAKKRDRRLAQDAAKNRASPRLAGDEADPAKPAVPKN